MKDVKYTRRTNGAPSLIQHATVIITVTVPFRAQIAKTLGTLPLCTSTRNARITSPIVWLSSDHQNKHENKKVANENTTWWQVVLQAHGHFQYQMNCLYAGFLKKLIRNLFTRLLEKIKSQRNGNTSGGDFATACTFEKDINVMAAWSGYHASMVWEQGLLNYGNVTMDQHPTPVGWYNTKNSYLKSPFLGT